MFKLLFNLLANLPLSMLYGLSHLLYVIGYKVFGYRRRIVTKNISKSFPDLSEEKINKIKEGFYKQFFQVWVETLKSKKFNGQEWNRRVDLKGIDLLNQHLATGQSVILMSGHAANWEWSGSAIGRAVKGQMTVFFKPVKNESFGKEIHSIREKQGIKAISKDNALRYLIKSKNTPQVIGMISDQSPSIGTEKYWMNFLNQETAFYQGAEKFATSMNYPVYYANMHRVSKGFYELELVSIYDGKSEIKQGEIIKRFAQHLENTIKDNPSDYLWSHKRWKYTKEEAAELTGRPYLFIS